MRILTDCSFLSEKQIEKIEERYNAKYVFESQLKLRVVIGVTFLLPCFILKFRTQKGRIGFEFGATAKNI
jgi:hypothetical protein